MKAQLHKWKHLIEKIGANPYLFCIVLGFLLNFGVELLSRKSLVSTISYLMDRPIIFLYNSMVIAFTVSFALFTRRRVFAFSFISLIWLSMGIVNSIVLVFRTTPFTATDLLLIKSAYTVMDSYLSWPQIILLVLAVMLVLIFTVLLLKKAPKRKEAISYRNVIGYVGGLFLIVYFATLAGMESGVLASRFGNIANAYIEYGFPYCFGNSLLNTGITKPVDYSEAIVDELMAKVEQPITHSESPDIENVAAEEEQPNIIFLQLESFFDPAYVEAIELSENPIPTFTALKEQFTSGFLNVPSVGAGTANTEFEIITGMNLDFFGPGEYPYKTVLKETTCESIAYNLKEENYKSHVIHNNDGTFYERHLVFPQLGFDSFTSLEYMNTDEYTELGWSKDSVLTGEIRKALRSTSERDVIYTISVQGHGSYPEEKLENPVITVTGLEETKNNSFEYYVNQLYEMDQFLAELLKMLSEYPERMILVMYGDHLPGFDFTDADLTNGDIYQTEYIIWDNYGLQKKDKDLEAYQLSAYVLEQVGLHNGILTKYHQNFANEETYLEGLQLLQYDMLYGNRDVYDGENPYQPTEMVMGTQPIYLYHVISAKDSSIILGSNFTHFSVVAVNGDYAETEYKDRYTLYIQEELKDGDVVTVHQAGEDSVSLSHTDEYIYHTAE